MVPMTPSVNLSQITKDGVTYEVVKAKPYEYKGNSRVSYTCKRPRGRRFYMIIGYENGTFSRAV